MVVFPWHWDAAKRRSVPILGLQHPTQVERRYSPSRMQILDPELTVPVALAARGLVGLGDATAVIGVLALLRRVGRKDEGRAGGGR